MARKPAQHRDKDVTGKLDFVEMRLEQIADELPYAVEDEQVLDEMLKALDVARALVAVERQEKLQEVSTAIRLVAGLVEAVPEAERPAHWKRLRDYLVLAPGVIVAVERRLGLVDAKEVKR